MAVSIRSLIQSAIPAEHRWKMVLLEKWDSIVGPLAGKVKIEKIEDGALILSVCHPSWAQELFLLSNMLRKKINAVLKEEKIKNIRFKVSVFNQSKKILSETTLSPSLDQLSVNKSPVPVKLTEGERDLLGNVRCEDLRAMLELFYARCKKRSDQRGGYDKNTGKIGSNTAFVRSTDKKNNR